MMSSYDKDYVDRLLAEINGDLQFATARRRLVGTVGQLTVSGKPGRGWAPSRLALVGLAREVDGNFLAHRYGARANRVSWNEAGRDITPGGWRWERVFDRDVVLVMPAWLYCLRRWWRWWRCWYWGFLNDHLPVRRGR